MGFKIVKQPRAWWPVTWDGVAEDGTITQNRIEMRFRLLKVDESLSFMAASQKAREQEMSGTGNLPEIYAGLVQQIADDWRGVHAENDTPLPWTDDNLKLLMNEPGMYTHVFEAFRRCLNGEAEIREGN